MAISKINGKRSSIVKRVSTLSSPLLLTANALTLGGYIASLRVIRGISQKELSRLSGLHLSVIRKLESDSGDAKTDQLQRAVRALKGVIIVTFQPHGFIESKHEKDLGMVFNVNTTKKEPTIFPQPFIPSSTNKMP